MVWSHQLKGRDGQMEWKASLCFVYKKSRLHVKTYIDLKHEDGKRDTIQLLAASKPE